MAVTWKKIEKNIYQCYILYDENCPVPVIKVDHQIRVPARRFFEWLDSLSAAVS